MISDIKEFNKIREIFCYFRRNYAFDEMRLYMRYCIQLLCKLLILTINHAVELISLKFIADLF